MQFTDTCAPADMVETSKQRGAVGSRAKQLQRSCPSLLLRKDFLAQRAAVRAPADLHRVLVEVLRWPACVRLQGLVDAALLAELQHRHAGLVLALRWLSVIEGHVDLAVQRHRGGSSSCTPL